MGMLVPNSTNCFSVLGSAAEPVEPPPPRPPGAKDGRYWIHAGLAKDKPNINVEHCSLIWPEPEKKAAPAR